MSSVQRFPTVFSLTIRSSWSCGSKAYLFLFPWLFLFIPFNPSTTPFQFHFEYSRFQKFEPRSSSYRSLWWSHLASQSRIPQVWKNDKSMPLCLGRNLGGLRGLKKNPRSANLTLANWGLSICSIHDGIKTFSKNTWCKKANSLPFKKPYQKAYFIEKELLFSILLSCFNPFNFFLQAGRKKAERKIHKQDPENHFSKINVNRP